MDRKYLVLLVLTAFLLIAGFGYVSIEKTDTTEFIPEDQSRGVQMHEATVGTSSVRISLPEIDNLPASETPAPVDLKKVVADVVFHCNNQKSFRATFTHFGSVVSITLTNGEQATLSQGGNEYNPYINRNGSIELRQPVKDGETTQLKWYGYTYYNCVSSPVTSS